MEKQWQKSRSFWEACGHAVDGIGRAIKQERNFRIQLVMYVLVLTIGWLLNISYIGLALIILTAVLILALELINTALETLSNVVSPEYSQELRYVKDVAAGAVMIMSLAAIVIGLLLFIPALQ
jgi:diacylglycerol kinase